MTSIFPAYSAVGTGNRPLTPQRAGAPSPVVSGKPRFSGDVFQIHQKLAAVQKADALRKAAVEAQEKQRAENEAQRRKEAEFKAICNTVVWRQGNQTLAVGDMVAFLCYKRPQDNYPGHGTLETLTQDFPGMDMGALRLGFEKLRQTPYYLGKHDSTGEFWLRPEGETMLNTLYPDILPPEKERFTHEAAVCLESKEKQKTPPPKKPLFTVNLWGRRVFKT